MKWFRNRCKTAPPDDDDDRAETHIALPTAWQMPVRGEIVELSVLPDPVFAEGMMGVGFAIRTTDELVRSPINGTVSAIFPGGHAIGLIDEHGTELLIHIGIDSVNLKGAGLRVIAAVNQTVALGDPLVAVDFALLNARLIDSAVIVVFNNIDCGKIVIEHDKPVWQAQ